MTTEKEQWSVYILRCADDTLYTGIAKNVERRVEQHNSDNVNGAKYTRARRPVELIYSEHCATRSEASKREYAIKRLSREAKLAIIESSNTTIDQKISKK